jgi:hypothetical protein
MVDSSKRNSPAVFSRITKVACSVAFTGMALTGCGTPTPAVRTVEVKVQVPVKCAAGARPDKPVNKYGSLPPGTGIDYALSALKSDRAAWETYGTKLNAATAGCWDEAKPNP